MSTNVTRGLLAHTVSHVDVLATGFWPERVEGARDFLVLSNDVDLGNSENSVYAGTLEDVHAINHHDDVNAVGELDQSPVGLNVVGLCILSSGHELGLNKLCGNELQHEH